MSVEICVTAGPSTGARFRLEGHASFLVGRDNPLVHFSLPPEDGYVSRYHLLFEVNGPRVHVRDLRSLNGTLVNGVRITDTDLRDGDLIQIGATSLLVRIDPPPPEPTPAGGKEPPDLGTGSTINLREPPRESGPVDPPRTGFEILRELGRGGVGIVYEARHNLTGQPVAIKTIRPHIRPSAEVVAKFFRETEVVRRLSHPNIVQFIGAGEHEGFLWFAMEYIPGEDAEKIVSRIGPLPVERACAWIIQALDALAYAHSVPTPKGTGFIHRDVKPSNLVVGQVEGRDHIKLVDFGLAKAYADSEMSGLTLTGLAGGTPHFMPPEQVRDVRSASPQSDIYAVGATLYFLLTGGPLFPSPPGVVHGVEDVFVRILEESPSRLETQRPDVPPELAATVHRAISKTPSERFSTAAEFARELRKFQGLPG